jgi:hypothetical protein
MAQRGDGFNKPSNFDIPERQRSLTPSQDTYTGQVLFYWKLLLGFEPPTANWLGLKIAGMGLPSDAPRSGNTTATMFAYIKQIERDLAAIEASSQLIVSGLAVLEISNQLIIAGQAAAAAQQQTLISQNTQIITLLTSIDNKTP